jgi:PLP dependent protein
LSLILTASPPPSESRLRDQIAANLAAVRERIARACERCDRDPASVRLVAVTKYARLEWVRAAIDLGLRDLGENRPQQLIERAEQFGHAAHEAESELPRWHLIGPLQRNKARKLLPFATWIHSVDSVKLLESIHRIAFVEEQWSSLPKLLLELNVSGETQKGGFRPEELDEGRLIAGLGDAAWQRLPIAGLMTMAPLVDDAEQARPVFRELRSLRDRWQEATGRPLPELSMGMSGDFEVAIEEGTTQVRIGSALWQGLADE